METEANPGPLPFLGALSRSARAEDRRLWLRVATDYFLRAKAPEAAVSSAFGMRFAACLAGADEDERVAIAKKLLSREGVPSNLLCAIMRLGGEAELLVLADGSEVPREALLAAARDVRSGRAVARRVDLDEEIIDALLDGVDPDASAALIANQSAPLGPRHILQLTALARTRIEATGDRALAELVLDRASNRLESAGLFLEASTAQRKAMLLAAQRAELGRPREVSPRAAPPEAIDRLERCALNGEIEEFVAVLAKILECSPELARRIAVDRSGEPLAVVLAAMGARNDVAVRILTASDLRDGGHYGRVGALSRLQDGLNPAAARRIVAALVDRREALPESAPARRSAPPSSERRERPPLTGPLREEVTPAVQRRRRAFALLAAYTKSKE